MTHRYDDIIGLSRPRSIMHPPMKRADRAAQFSSFAALTGLEDAIAETARQTDEKPELDEGEKARINEALLRIMEVLPEVCEATFSYYEPDKRKPGGAILTVSGSVCRINLSTREILLSDGRKILIDALLSVQ